MAVLTKEDKELLNKLADSQPALNKPGKVLGESQVKLGDSLEQASGASAKKVSWSFAKQGGTGTIDLGSIPSGSIITSIVIDKKGSTVDSTDAEIQLDAQSVLVSTDLSLPVDIEIPAILPKKATAGLLQLVFNVDATSGEMDIIVHYTGV